MMKPNPRRAVLIAGPTASGKSALALEFAREENGVIINADSMQVYRELRIITARPSLQDEAQAEHQLYGHVGATEDYSVARWQREAMAEIEIALAQGKLPIIVGGTGLYFMSLIKGLSEVPEIRPEVREKWRAFEGNHHVELANRDRAMAAKLHPSDKQRLIRALEVIESTGKSLLFWQESIAAPLKDFELRKLFKNIPREDLYKHADARFDQMLEQGALEEVKALPPLHKDQPLIKAIGVPELLQHVHGAFSLEEAKDAAKTATRQYIKRQLTWWRGQMKDWTDVT
jgi:tRNA dimethylallyltransferase